MQVVFFFNKEIIPNISTPVRAIIQNSLLSIMSRSMQQSCLSINLFPLSFFFIVIKMDVIDFQNNQQIIPIEDQKSVYNRLNT